MWRIELFKINYLIYLKSLVLNFDALFPKAWKEGLITCLLHRAKTVCSTAQDFKTEIDNLKRIFIRNCYPNSFFNLILPRFLNQLRQQLISTAEEEERKILFKVSYLGKISKLFFDNIRSAVKRKYGISIVPVYEPTNSVCHHTTHRDISLNC